MDPNRLHPSTAANGYAVVHGRDPSPTPPMNPNPIYATIGPPQPNYNPGWSMPNPNNGSAFTPLHPNQQTYQQTAYPQQPLAAPIAMPPKNHYIGATPLQNPYGLGPVPPQNIYGHLGPMPPQNPYGCGPIPPPVHYGSAPMAGAHPSIAYLEQPRRSIEGLPGVPTYNPQPQILPAKALLSKPGQITKEEQKRLKKMMKEQEKMEKKKAKAMKHFH